MATAAAKTNVEIKGRRNARGLPEYSVKGKHVSVKDLKKHILEDSEKKLEIWKYFVKKIPGYPSPVELHVSQVSHVTDAEPFQRILQSEGFKPPGSNFNLSWWSLNIKDEEIKSAEKRYLQEIFPNQSQEQTENHEPFLHRFTNSPAFQSESRYGNYRFTFPLTELMKMYQEQHCGGEEPVLRVLKTMFYKQEIVYTVLIHSPLHDERTFASFPLLEDSKFVHFQDGEIIWHAQAISDNLTLALSVNTEEATVKVVSSSSSSKYYVWDHVCLAFYLPERKNTLRVPKEKLIEASEACKLADIDLTQSRKAPTLTKEGRFLEAQKEIMELKGKQTVE